MRISLRPFQNPNSHAARKSHSVYSTLFSPTLIGLRPLLPAFVHSIFTHQLSSRSDFPRLITLIGSSHLTPASQPRRLPELSVLLFFRCFNLPRSPSSGILISLPVTYLDLKTGCAAFSASHRHRYARNNLRIVRLSSWIFGTHGPLSFISTAFRAVRCFPAHEPVTET